MMCVFHPILSRWLAVGLVLAIAHAHVLGAEPEMRPNVVLILADDLGYSDVGVYGAEEFATPHLDRLAREGIRFTDFHVAQGVCSASRAALMTGCYPNRVGITGALEPWDKFGLSANELTLPQMMKQKGYVTG